MGPGAAEALDGLGDWGLLATDARLTVTGWNGWLERRAGLPADRAVGRPLLDLFPGLAGRGLDRYYRQALAGRPALLSQRLHRHLLPLPAAPGLPPGSMEQAARVVPLLDAGAVCGTLTVIEDVTDRVARESQLRDRARDLAAANAGLKQEVERRTAVEAQLRVAAAELEARVAERTAALRESEERFRNAFDHAPEGMWMAAPDGRWLRVNAAYCRTVGRSEEEMRATDVAAVTHPEDRAACLAAVGRVVAGGADSFHAELRHVHARGHDVWVVLSAALVRDAAGGPLYLVGHAQDVTERRAAERRVRQSLEEQAVLLREVHHRVKNNLQVISSLLYMQSQMTRDAASAEMFRDSQHRVRSMALVHERMYRSRDFARVNFADHLRGLADYLFRSYKIDADRVRVAIDARDVSLPLDAAVPCALLVNELVSNCLKHAFPGGAAGRVEIGLAPAGDGEVALTVRDDGVGLPPGVGPEAGGSFGMTLVGSLVDQIRGRVEVRRDAGTAYRVLFPAAPPGGRGDGP